MRMCSSYAAGPRTTDTPPRLQFPRPAGPKPPRAVVYEAKRIFFTSGGKKTIQYLKQNTSTRLVY